MPPNRLKQLLAEGRTALGLWVTLESPSITEIATVMGLDWVVIDCEHGHLDFKETMEHIRAARNTDTTVLVRIQEIEEGLIKRVLDIGAQGLIIPQVRSAADVARAVRFAKYPPMGVRGIGAERATRWALGIEGSVPSANQNTLIIPLIENVEAVADIEAILEVPGIDALFFGPHDLSASAGHPGAWDHPEVARDILRIRALAEARGLPGGILAAGPEEGRRRLEQGFNMLAVGIDTILLVRSAQAMMEALGRPVPGEAWNE